MPKRLRRKPEDEVQAGIMAVRASVGEKSAKAQPPKLTKSLISELMAQIGRKGGKIGGKRRAQRMTEKERSNAAAMAARARWAKRPAS